MTFVSYAQNFEDVMLWRALKLVHEGFYVDVGAQDPVEDSVTRAFYGLGWRGINIEPVGAWFEKLQRERPRDINLQLAAGDRKGRIRIYEIVDSGLSTADQETARRHVMEGGYESRAFDVELRPLSEILAEHAGAEIHFLKVDVEGMEERVLRGNDWQLFRPWVLLVEATEPNRQAENFESWEPIVVGAGYQFVYRDGLNRFYLAKEHLELEPAFRSPPNVFDEFRPWGQVRAEQRALRSAEQATWAERRAAQAEARADEAEAWSAAEASRADQAEARAARAVFRAARAEASERKLEARVWAIEHSRSWRATAPLRGVLQSVRALRRLARRSYGASRAAARRAAGRLARPLGRFLYRRGWIRWAVGRILAYFPGLRERLHRWLSRDAAGFPHARELSPRAARIHAVLLRRMHARRV